MLPRERQQKERRISIRLVSPRGACDRRELKRGPRAQCAVWRATGRLYDGHRVTDCRGPRSGFDLQIGGRCGTGNRRITATRRACAGSRGADSKDRCARAHGAEAEDDADCLTAGAANVTSAPGSKNLRRILNRSTSCAESRSSGLIPPGRELSPCPLRALRGR